MYLVVNNKKLVLIEFTSFIDRFKSIRFILQPIDYIIKFPRKKKLNTNFFCQRVDVVFTDKQERILDMFPNFGSEDKVKVKGSYNVYLFPLGSCFDLRIGDILKFKE